MGVYQSKMIAKFVNCMYSIERRVGSHDPAAAVVMTVVWQLPSSELWLKTSAALYKLFMLDHDDDARARTHFSSLSSQLDINQRFSDA